MTRRGFLASLLVFVWRRFGMARSPQYDDLVPAPQLLVERAERDGMLAADFVNDGTISDTDAGIPRDPRPPLYARGYEVFRDAGLVAKWGPVGRG